MPASKLFPVLIASAVVALMVTVQSSAQTFTTLVNFDGNDGGNPYFIMNLVQGRDGKLYGTTSKGTAFRMATSGALTTLNRSLSFPFAGLVLATDGNFYGTTEYGGTNFGGTVFKMTPGGTVTTLYSFCAQANCADGSIPYAALIEGHDGSLYGATTDRGVSRSCCGTVFKITTSGEFTSRSDSLPAYGQLTPVFVVWGISHATYSQIPTQAKTGLEWATRQNRKVPSAPYSQKWSTSITALAKAWGASCGRL